jgi:hypothetical protein
LHEHISTTAGVPVNYVLRIHEETYMPTDTIQGDRFHTSISIFDIVSPEPSPAVILLGGALVGIILPRARSAKASRGCR